MKQEATNAHQQVSDKGDQENRIMAISSTASHAQIPKIHKQEVRQGIDNFRRVGSGIVVLGHGQPSGSISKGRAGKLLHTS